MDTLISDIHRDFFDEMIKKYTTENLERLSDLQIHQKAISGMIEYVEQNRKLAKILFSHGDRRLLEKNMFTYFKERYYSKRPDILEVYPFTYHTMAFISLLNTWINDDFPCSADQFSKIIYEHSATLWNIPYFHISTSSNSSLSNSIIPKTSNKA